MTRAALVCILVAGCKDSGPTPAEVKVKLEAALAGARPGEEHEIDGMFVTMYRMQATAPLGDGWHRAASTKGGFSVDVPIPFNDYRLRAKAEDGVDFMLDTIGAKTPGLMAWGAVCGTRADGKMGRASEPPPTNKTETVGSPVRAWQRTIVLDQRVCTLIVEAQGTDPLPADTDIQRFLRSFAETAR